MEIKCVLPTDHEIEPFTFSENIKIGFPVPATKPCQSIISSFSFLQILKLRSRFIPGPFTVDSKFKLIPSISIKKGPGPGANLKFSLSP